MTYAQQDKSIEDSAPIEAYKFYGLFGAYRYTNADESIVVAGEIYTPNAITRTAIEVTSATDSNITMDFIIPANDPLATLFCLNVSPDELIVEVRSVQRGTDYNTDYRVEWIGYSLDTSISDDYATIKTGSLLQTKLKGNLATVYYQRSCNHDLYDTRCKVDPAAFTFVATITKIEAQLITVDSDGTADGELLGGTIVNTRTGEERGIYTNFGNIVTISYPFIDVEVGDEVNLIMGCDHNRLGHCKLRFNNVVNYGGHDFIPTTNPFTDLRPDKIVTTTVKQARVPTSPHHREPGFRLP